MRTRLLLSSASVLLFAACVDTTGISKTTTRPPHPKSNANAAVTVEEFADFQCPACKAAHTVILEPLLEKYGKNIRFEFRHFPIASIHRNALTAAQGGECAADQNKFWEFETLDYTEQEKLVKSPDAVFEWAEKLELDMELFRRCMKSGIKKDIVMADYNAGRELGVKGTPTFFVNGERVDSEIEKIEAAIDAKLKEMQQKL